MAIFKKTISIILVLCLMTSMVLVASISVSANAGDSVHRKLITDVVNSDSNNQVETNTYMFYLPKEWKNEYNDYYNYNPEKKDFSGEGGYFAPGIFWGEGDYNCNDYKGDLENAWPGYAVTETLDENPNIYKAIVPKCTGMIVWNNLVDSGTDNSKPYYSASLSTTYISDYYAAPYGDGYGFYPDGLSSFDGMIFVCNPKAIEENSIAHGLSYKGAWFYYYGDGEYGYYKTRKEAAENNAVYKDGEFPPSRFIIDKEEATIDIGECIEITSTISNVKASSENPDIASVKQKLTGEFTVKGLKAGSTRISFTDGYNTVICNLTVNGDEEKTEDNDREKRIKGLKVDDLELEEFVDGYETKVDETGEFFLYSLHPGFTVLYNDGTKRSFKYDYEDNSYKGADNYDFYFYCDGNQDPENGWTVGTYKATGEFYDYSTNRTFEDEFNVTINPNPVESVEFEPVSLVEGLDLSKKYTNINDSYYSYCYIPKYKVKFKNGSVAESNEDGEIYYKGRYHKVSYNDGQSKDNQWKAGDHKIDAKVLGCKSSFTVSIKETPIEKVTVNDIAIIKGTHTDEGNNSHYSYAPDFTVTLKDGKEIKSIEGGIKLDDEKYFMYVEDGQYDNPWEKTGTYKVKGSFCGKYYDFNVNIIDSPIKDVKAETLELIEKVDGYLKSSGEFYYVLRVPQYTVILNNGEKLKSDEEGNVWYKGMIYRATIDEEQTNWKVGETYKPTFSFLDEDVEFDVKIVPSPVAKIEVEPIEVIDHADIDYTTDDGNIVYRVDYDDWDNNPTKVNCIVTLNDGTVLKNDKYGIIKYKGGDYKVFTDAAEVQKSGAYWTVGNTYKISVYALGKSETASVTVVPTPVDRIEVEDVQLTEYKDGKEIYDVYNLWFRYNSKPVEFKIFLKDGTVIKSDENFKLYGYNYISYNDTLYKINYDDDQTNETPWSVGKHEAEMSVLGFTQKYNVFVNKKVKPVETDPETDPVVTPTAPAPTAPAPTAPAPIVVPTVPAIDHKVPLAKTKAANQIKVTVKAKTIKAKKLKSKAQKVKVITVKEAKGKVTYKLTKIPKKIKKFLKINSKGVITFKKWKKAEKGTYKFNVKITAKGNSKFNKKTITKTIKLRIK